MAGWHRWMLRNKGNAFSITPATTSFVKQCAAYQSMSAADVHAFHLMSNGQWRMAGEDENRTHHTIMAPHIDLNLLHPAALRL